MPPTVVIGRGIAAEATVKFVQRGGSRGLLRGGAVEHESGKRGVPVSIARARDQFRLYSRVNKKIGPGLVDEAGDVADAHLRLD